MEELKHYIENRAKNRAEALYKDKHSQINSIEDYSRGFNDAKVEDFQGFIWNYYDVELLDPEAVLLYRLKTEKDTNNWLLFDEVYLIFLKSQK